MDMPLFRDVIWDIDIIERSIVDVHKELESTTFE
jgi:hypothetical protein